MNAESENGTHVGRLLRRRGKRVGIVTVNAIDGVHRSENLGYWIAKDSQGEEIVTESSRNPWRSP